MAHILDGHCTLGPGRLEGGVYEVLRKRPNVGQDGYHFSLLESDAILVRSEDIGFLGRPVGRIDKEIPELGKL